MINDNIRKCRKEKGLSQEEMAVRLHVVRQTVSKWENGLSVPDAEVLIRMAELLEVSVSKLLGIGADSGNVENLASELASLNEELAERNRKETALKRANEKRGQILVLSFVSMLVLLLVQNSVLSIILSAVCTLLAIAVLYKNLALLTSITTEDMRIKTLRISTVCNICTLIIAVVLAVLTAMDVISFSERSERAFAMLLVACVMIFAGIISPKLPYTRHTGLRLPWTVQDRDTWNLAHRILGYISLPVALLYIACSLTIENFEMVTLFAMLVWIGIPGGISYLFYRKKFRGN